MRAGWEHGSSTPSRSAMDIFVRADGYTSVATATALLASICLVLCLATVEWALSRSADVQDVADATALAGANVVARYTTIAQELDACVLSMGIAGTIVVAGGLVLSAVPGAGSAAVKAMDLGRSILDARNRFARSSAEGLRKLELLIPGAVVARSWQCAQANADGGVSYMGAALPVPFASQSDFSSLEQDVQSDEVTEAADRMQEAADRAEEAKRRADEALERAWTADCVDEPRCMRSRAQDLAGLYDAQNPYVASADSWTFGVAIQRSRAYYAQRLAQEEPRGDDIESRTDSAARRAFYEYALDEVNAAWYEEYEDGTVSLYLPHLARTSGEVRQTQLYDDPVWPCSQEEEGVTLHAVVDCPGATGNLVGYDSVAAVDSGDVRRCDVCGMDVADLGAVASISTIATNGYEHYWQIVVEEADDYARARDEQADAERLTREASEEGERAFDRLMEQLGVPRPNICPPGAWGCVGVVMRGGGTASPSSLTSTFAEGVTLPAGAAASAATLAPDDAQGDGLLSHVFDEVAAKCPSWGGALRGASGLMGRLLSSYSNAYEDVGSIAGGFLDNMDGVFGSTVASWLRGRLKKAIEAMGLQPADLRMRKPVLVSTQDVLERAGIEPAGKLRELVQTLPASGSASDVAHAVGIWAWDEASGRIQTVAELPIPGTGSTVPLGVDLLGEGGVP